MYATNMYFMFWNEWTGKAPVRSVYMVTVLASASAAKHRTAWTPQASWGGGHLVNLKAGDKDVSVVGSGGGNVGTSAPHVAFVGGG